MVQYNIKGYYCTNCKDWHFKYDPKFTKCLNELKNNPSFICVK